MRVLLAGATGAIGRPLVGALQEAGHEVLALVRDPGRAPAGVQPIVADLLDRDSVLSAVDGQTADAVVHEATALAKPKRTLDADDPTNALRIRGTAHLIAAAQHLGASRFLTQSLVCGYGYLDHGDHLLSEQDTFGRKTGSVADHVVDGLLSTEEQAFAVGGIALRYGVLYGPGTWFDPDGQGRAIPVPWDGGGVMSWVHVQDAARATVSALELGVGGQAYNIVDSAPMTWREKAVQVGRRSPRLPGALLRLAVPYLGALMIDTMMRVSNAKARAELSWSPRAEEGFTHHPAG